MASYTYDPYGKVDTATGSMAAINPLRYRGYYYDTETGFYYLQSRYYDPAICRFINADEYSSTGQGLLGYNMFAYCNNNPVMAADPNGEWLNFVVGAVVGAIIGGVTAAISSYKETGSVNLASVALGAATGAVGGLIGASGVPAVGQAVASGLLSAANNIGNSLIAGEKIDLVDVAIDATIGAVSSAVGSIATKKAASAAKNTIAKGIRRVISGKNRYDSGSRYWKGAMKRGMEIISQGVADLNFAQGTASVIGSETAGIASTIKMLIPSN